VADPIGDGAILAGSLAFSVILDQLTSTGEIRPQQPEATSSLLSIDRFAVTQTVDPNASLRSNIGLYAAVAFAITDPLVSAFRDGPTTALVDAVLYAESISVTTGITDLTKIAIRRPRPTAYIEQQQLYAKYGRANAPDITTTDSALSFFSGHASTVATIGATATYLAFARSPDTARPWLTLGGFTVLTAFVSYERVRAGAHFPTDVIAGSLAGAGIGTLVVHLHREESARQRPVWIGATPITGGGGFLTASGVW
jgi:undecaprenyl-diphosphatase